MDPVVGGAVVSGVSDFASGAMGGKAAKEAAKAQLTATREALAFQREQKAAEEKRYADAMNMWLAGRQELLSRYGLPATAIGPYRSGEYPMPEPYKAPTPEEQTLARLKATRERLGGGPLGALMDKLIPKVESKLYPAGKPTASSTPSGSLQTLLTNEEPPPELTSWNDWERYGLRQG